MVSEKVFKFTPPTLFPRQEPPHPLLVDWVSPRASQDLRKKVLPLLGFKRRTVQTAAYSLSRPRYNGMYLYWVLLIVETTKTFHSYSCMQALMGFDSGSLKVKGC